jgi:hypothetical protein
VLSQHPGVVNFWERVATREQGDADALIDPTLCRALRSQTNVASVTPNNATTKALTSTGASSTLSSQLDVTGTPMVGDNLVFHFMATQSATGIGGGFLTGSDVWRLLLNNANTSDFAKVGQQFTSTGTADPLALTNATQVAGGYDLFLPFAAGNTFFYNFQSLISCPDNQQPAGAAASCSLDVNLDGITAQNANGETYASATFDQTTGFGAINLQAGRLSCSGWQHQSFRSWPTATPRRNPCQALGELPLNCGRRDHVWLWD